MSGALQAAAPTGILLTPSTVKEGSPEDMLVGTLTAVDADPGDTHVFSMVFRNGIDDYEWFWILGNKLLVNRDLKRDFESGDLNFDFRVKVTDSQDNSFEQNLVVLLTDNRDEDADRDGLTEAQEEDVYGTSDVAFDSDGDGVGDSAELAAGTSPTNPNNWPPSTLIGWGKSSEGELNMPVGEEFVVLSTGQNHSLAVSAAGALESWGGYDSYGQTTPPPGLGDLLALSAGGDFWEDDSAYSVALRSDGTVVAWGYDKNGQTEVPAGLGPVIDLSAGRSHCVALKSDGTVVTWGSNPFGGIEPPAGLSDVVAVSAGGFFTLALKGDGTVVAWGNYFDGNEWKEVRVPVGLADVVAISAGRFHSLVLKSDGTLVAWGYDEDGQTTVPSGLANVTAIAAGGFHSLALRNDGSVVAWGANGFGQATVPFAALSGVKLISAGMVHSLAVHEGGEYPTITSPPAILASPGTAVEHQIVVSTPGTANLEFFAIGLPTGLTIDPVTGIISGSVLSPVRRAVRIHVKAGPRNLTQNLWLVVSEGQAPTAVVLTPPSVMENAPAETLVGILTAEDADVGDSHTFEWVEGVGSGDNEMFRIEGNQLILNQALTRDFEKNAAGFTIRVRARDVSLNPFETVLPIQFLDDRTEDEDGDGLTEEQEEDIYLTSDTLYDKDGDGFGDGFEVAQGTDPTLATSVPSGRILVAWGDNTEGQTIPPAGMGDVVALSAGHLHSVALKRYGSVVAWGRDEYGQGSVPENLGQVIAVEAGNVHNIALKADGTVTAWGNNDAGQIEVPPDLSGVVAISAGAYHNLALKTDGTVSAWGIDDDGQATVPADLTNVVAVAAGGFHSLALKSDGTVVAWGWNGYTSVPQGLGGVIAIAAGGTHNLALRFDGTVIAWGDDDYGQATVPEDLTDVVEISAGWQHCLALKTDGTVVAWGRDTERQIRVPAEAIHIRKIAAGEFHNLAIRELSGFPAFADVSPVRGWLGETVEKSSDLVNASVPGSPGVPPYSAMGLPSELTLDPVTGLVSGTVSTGQRRAARISADTDQGMLSRVIWFDTASGVAPTAILLSHSVLAENSPAGTVVGTFTVIDPNAGDTHTMQMADLSEAPDNYRFQVSGNKLVVKYPLNADFDTGMTQLQIRVVALDSVNQAFAQDFTLELTDDRTEDHDGDGFSESVEEDIFGTSDADYEKLSTADGDQDGIPGLIELAFNLDPKAPGPPLRLLPGAESTAGLPTINLMDDGLGHHRLRMEYLRRIGGQMLYIPQFTGDLAPGDWQPAESPVVTPVDAQWERCVVVDTMSIETSPRRFGRVLVEYLGSDRTQDVDQDGVNQAMEEDIFGSSDSLFNNFVSEDLDQDGVPGMIEYAFNLDPRIAGPPVTLVPGAVSLYGLPSITLVPDGSGGFRLRVEYLRRIGGILSYVPQFSGGLKAAAWAPGANPVSVTPIDEDWERCVIEDTEVTTEAARRFARVAISW